MDTATVATPVDERDVFVPPADFLPPAPCAPAKPQPAVLPPELGPPPVLPARPSSPDPAGQTPAWLPDLSRRHMAAALKAAIDLEIERGTPFLLVPVFLAIGAIVNFNLRQEPPVWMLATAAIAAIAIFAATRHRRVVEFAGAALSLVLLGLVLGGVETARLSTPMLGGEIATTLTGRVIDLDRLDNGRTRLVLDVVATERPKLRYVPKRVRVSARKVPEGLRAGALVTGLARLQPPSGPVRPGSYDFSFESYFDGIGATGFFMRGPDIVPAPDPQAARASLADFVANLRMEVADRVRARIGGPEGDIAAALMVGVRAGIPEDVNEAMRRSGLYHIISISGLHMALVAGVFMGFFRACLALFPGLASRHPVKKIAAFAAILAISAYLFISGSEVAAERSFVMLAVMLAAVLFDRAALTMRNLAISALVVIVISPHEIVGPSFQMSFAATAALVGAYAWWSDRPARRQASVPERSLLRAGAGRAATVTLGLVVTSLVAGLATAAFGVYHFQRVSPLGLASNLAAMPVVSFVVMPFGVLSALAMPFGLEGPFLEAMGWGLSAMIAISRWFSERSPVDAVGQISGLSVALLAIALIVAAMSTTWLRLFAVPIAMAGLIALPATRTPDVLVAEDGRLVGVATGSGSIAVDRERPNAFTLVNWKRTLGVDDVVKPAMTAPEAKTEKGKGAARQNPASRQLAASVRPQVGRFHCDDTRCVIALPDGGTLVHTRDAEVARNACASARIIVLDDPTVDLACADRTVAVIGARALARSGSAAVYLSDEKPGMRPTVDFAIDGNARPWHRHRVHSRAARGMAPFVPKPKPPAVSTETPAAPVSNRSTPAAELRALPERGAAKPAQ